MTNVDGAMDTTDNAIAMGQLSLDVLPTVFRYLNLTDLASASMVCKAWNEDATYELNHIKCQWEKIDFSNLLEDQDIFKFLRIFIRLNLKWLDLSKTIIVVSDRVAKDIVYGCPNLLTFVVNRPNQLTEDSLKIILSGCKMLKHLDISHTGIIVTDALAQTIANSCPNLERFWTDETNQLKDNGLKLILGGCKGIIHLDLSHTYVIVSDSLAQAIADACPHLRTFVAGRPNQLVTENCLKIILSGCKMLRHLNLSTSGITISNFLAHIIADKCPNLETFVANGLTLLMDASLKVILGGCKALKHLEFSNSGLVVSDSIAQDIADACPHLEKFAVSGTTQLSENSLKIILEGCGKTLTHLGIAGKSKWPYTRNRRIDINSANCEKENVLENVFRFCPNLETLDISNLPAAKRPYVVENMMPSLKRLIMPRDNPGQEGQEDFFDPHLVQIFEKTPNLEVLNVAGNFVGSDLYELPRLCPKVVELDVGACHINWQDDLDDLLAHLEGLKLTNFSCANFAYNLAPFQFPFGVSRITAFQSLSTLSLTCMMNFNEPMAIELIKKLPLLTRLVICAIPSSRNLETLLRDEAGLARRRETLICDISWGPVTDNFDRLIEELNIRIICRGNPDHDDEQ